MFRRGVPQDVPEKDYLFLLSQGFIDPTHELAIVHPSRIARAPANTEVPVIRTGGMGDVLMVLPGLRALAKRFPRLRFTYATSHEFVPLLRDCDFLHRVVPLSDLAGRYSWAIDLRGYSEREGRERFDRPGVFAKYLLNGGEPEDWSYPLVPTEEERARGRELTGAAIHQRPVIGIVIGSHSQSGMRNWPMTYVEELVELAFAAGMRCVLIDDRVQPLTPRLAAAGCLSLAGHLSISQLMAVVASCDFIVSPDTGVFHLAEALGTRTVGYFTSVPPAARAAHYQHSRTIYAGVSCSPCYHAPSCGAPPGSTLCAREVQPVRVWLELEWMGRREPPYHYAAPFSLPEPAAAAPVRFSFQAA
jgi:heptosyltransferase-2